ncbi:MAG TPA: hypothetical protein VK932_02795 [Kofleriaceae bacterium]|nr:hypothetical protein [Kofleriaceae bacterium]
MDRYIEIDPVAELTGGDLREAVVYCLEIGRISLEERHTRERMIERRVTAPQIEGVLRSGALRSEGLGRDSWRYSAAARGVVVVFTFDIDDEGALLVVITAIRPARQP